MNKYNRAIPIIIIGSFDVSLSPGGGSGGGGDEDILIQTIPVIKQVAHPPCDPGGPPVRLNSLHVVFPVGQGYFGSSH